jgi:hypothetical protein
VQWTRALVRVLIDIGAGRHTIMHAVSIWAGIRGYFASAGVNMDFVLYTTYEAQVDTLLKPLLNLSHINLS